MITMTNVTVAFQIATSLRNTPAINSDDHFKRGVEVLSDILDDNDLVLEDIQALNVIIESGGNPEWEDRVKTAFLNG